MDFSVAFATSCHLPGLLQCQRRQTISCRLPGPSALTITHGALAPCLTTPLLLPPCSWNLKITVQSPRTSLPLASLWAPNVSAASFLLVQLGCQGPAFQQLAYSIPNPLASPPFDHICLANSQLRMRRPTCLLVPCSSSRRTPQVRLTFP